MEEPRLFKGVQRVAYRRRSQTEVALLPVIVPTPILEDPHARMDRLERRIRQMKTSDEAITWEDFNGAPVASLSTKFRMSKIERYTDIGFPRIHLRLYSTERVGGFEIKARGVGHLIYLPLKREDFTGKEAFRRTETRRCECYQTVGQPSGFYYPPPPHASYFIPSAPSPIDYYFFCTKVDTIVLPTRMDLYCSYYQGLGHDTDHCTALRHAIEDLIDQGLVHLGQPSVTTNPLSAYTSHAVSLPTNGIHFMDFTKPYDHIHMLSWDESVLEPIVVDGIYETPFVLIPDVDEVHTPYVDDVHTPDIQYVIHRDDDLPPEGSDHTCPLYILVGFLGHRVLYVILDDDPTLNVCPLAYVIALGYASSNFGPSTQKVRAYDSIKREVMGTLVIKLLIGPTTFPILFQKVKFIHDGQVITVRSIGDMFASSKPMLQISHNEDDLFFTGFTFDEEVELQRLVHQLRLSDGAPGTSASALATPSFPNHMSLMTLYFLDEVDEHGTFAEIRDMVDGVVPHDRYIDEMLAMSMSQIDGIVQPEFASPFDLFGVSAIEVAEEIQIAPALEFSEDDIVDDDVFVCVNSPVMVESKHVDPPLSFDILSRFVSHSDDLLTFSSYMDMSLFEYLPISCDNTLSAPHSPTSQIFDIDDEIVHHNSDADSSSAFDLSPSDQRVSPTTGDAEIVDFGTTDQPRELRIGLDLFTDESGGLVQLLISYLDVFAWSYEDMSGLDPFIVKEEIQKQLSVGFLSVVEYPEWLANVVLVPKKNGKNAGDTYQRAATILFPDMMHQDVERAFERIMEYLFSPLVLVPPTPGRPLFLYLSVSDIALGCMLAQLNDSGNERAIYYLSKRMLDYETRYVMIERFCLALVWATKRLRHYMMEYSVHLISCLDPLRYLFDRLALIDRLIRCFSDGRAIDDDFLDEDIAAVTTSSGWRMYFDGAANHSRHEIGVLLISHHGDHIPRFVRLAFFDRHLAMNNIVEYEACILGLETTLKLGIRQMEVFSDSNLLVVGRFDDLSYTHLPRAQNQFVDALATLASMIDIPADTIVRPLLIESRSVPTYCCLIDEAELDDGLPWYYDIYQFLRLDIYPEVATTKDKRALR
ncbi:hypothetical protein CK203_050316 [Vitis vinifera]|uniref:Reverse transcriptase/retrotransposon-derived protein RNase H-like domain-containing protein n=1 Tax=Vitis vinifera TaxID=29760 RepID=A0A438H0A1_VITVI|nr:hypothetical protein CK203_050316 [Vitis vinifera]